MINTNQLYEHVWECTSSGMYDSLYTCLRCNKNNMWSVDNLNSENPQYGCIPEITVSYEQEEPIMEMKPLEMVPSEPELAILLNRLGDCPEAQNILRRVLFHRDILKGEIGNLQHVIDELMLEYCPEDMSIEQVEEYEKHQRVSKMQLPEKGGSSL